MREKEEEFNGNSSEEEECPLGLNLESNWKEERQRELELYSSG